MTTITLKINERSSYGKALLELIKVGIDEKKGVEMVEEDNPYSPEFMKMIKEAEEDIKAGRTTEVKDVNKLWESL